MNRQVSNLMKQREEKAHPNPQSSGKELGQDTQGFPRAWDPWGMQQSQVGIKTVQEGMPRNTRNHNKYVPISHPMMQKKDRKAQEPTTHE